LEFLFPWEAEERGRRKLWWKKDRLAGKKGAKGKATKGVRKYARQNVLKRRS